MALRSIGYLFCLILLPLVCTKAAENKEAEQLEYSLKVNENYIKQLKSQNLTWSPDLDTWEAPAQVKKDLPYYFAGYDYEKRPVIVTEYGKWNIRKYFDAGEKSARLYDKYLEQLWWRMKNLKSPYADAEDGVVWLNDMRGFNVQQLSVEVVRNQLLQSRRLEFIQDHIADAVWFNLNFISQVWLNILRPIAGKLVGRIETYGPNKEKWIPALRLKIPKEHLPPWYGGNPDFKPAKVF